MRVRLLGGFEIEGFDGRSLGTRKARVLLRRLAGALGRPVAVDELADAVWGEELPANPNDQLSVLVSRLRGVLGADRLRRGDAGYALVAEWFDVVELEARTAELESRVRLGHVGSALAAAEAALALARGPLLPEVDAPWADEARLRAGRLMARAGLLAAEAMLAGGDASSARGAAEAVLDRDPYDEAALRLVMRADVAAGRPAAALAVYAAARRRLAEDLGVDPARETEALHTTIVRGEISLATSPTSGPPLVGRVEELRFLDEGLARVRAGESTVVVVEADAGMGKSALLAAWMARWAGSALVIAGRCDELGRDLPLQPVVDGLTAHLRAVGRRQADTVLADDAATVAPLLRRGVASGRGPLVTTVLDAESSRLALFEAVAAVFERAAGGQPLALVVDDLHVAAPGTAEFLSFAARRTQCLVVAARRRDPGPDLPGAHRLSLGPLSLADAVAFVGADRGPALHERSGGHPLFLVELARASDGALPASIVGAVNDQLAGLGDAAATVQAAAILGSTVDVELLAAVADLPVRSVLDDLERAAQARLLAPRGPVLAFAHELVRVAIDAGASPARRVLVHRLAADALATRSGADPLVIAFHARLGGNFSLAAQALTHGAARAADRYELGMAEGLLDEALAVADNPATRLARGRLQLARLDLDGARGDALAAIGQGAGAAGFELAGWVAYYGRQYSAARRYADEGAQRATDDAVRASCLALAGRIRHTRGELAAAAARLAEAVDKAPSAVRGVAQVWHAQLLAHQGAPEAAAELARRGLLDPHLGHPFAPLHGRFTLAFALALSGRWAAALEAVDDLDRATVELGDRRFPAVNANIRGWLWRGAGLLEAAADLHRQAAAMSVGPSFLEPRYAALLDLAEDGLAADDADRAGEAVGDCADILEWEGSMSWRHRDRYRLVTARLASRGGDHDTACELARTVAATAIERGNPRYECRAGLIAATAEARAGREVDAAGVEALIDRFIPLCGPDGWRDLAELSSAARCERWWHRSEHLAGGVVADAAPRLDVDGFEVAAAVRRQLDHWRP